jgi:hypothetical protein
MPTLSFSTTASAASATASSNPFSVAILTASSASLRCKAGSPPASLPATTLVPPTSTQSMLSSTVIRTGRQNSCSRAPMPCCSSSSNSAHPGVLSRSCSNSCRNSSATWPTMLSPAGATVSSASSRAACCRARRIAAASSISKSGKSCAANQFYKSRGPFPISLPAGASFNDSCKSSRRVWLIPRPDPAASFRSACRNRVPLHSHPHH